MQLSQRQTNWIASAASQIWTLQQTIIHIINADKMQLQLPQSKIMEDHLVVHIVDYIDRMSSICTPRNESCARGPTAAQGLSTPILHLASNGHSSTMDLKLNNDNFKWNRLRSVLSLTFKILKCMNDFIWGKWQPFWAAAWTCPHHRTTRAELCFA